MNPKDLLIQGLFKVNPYWDEIPWNRQRDTCMRASGVRPGRTRRIVPFVERPVHLVVIPQVPLSDPSLEAGNRDIYFEAGQLLAELIGQDKVSFFGAKENEYPETWQARLVEYVNKTRATHILTHIEGDPGGPNDSWTWDQAFQRLLDSDWDGALLGVNFDSAFKWIRARSRRLARMSPQFVAVDICMPLDGMLVKGRQEVGPVNMPVSNMSLQLVNSEIGDVEKKFDVSFIGALYPYRVELIKRIRSRGIKVAVNPHRPDETTDFVSSRSNQPSWLQYMRGLASSHMTINFSQSSAGPFEQLKTRVIEATLAGTFLLTDDKDRTRLFFEADEFATFNSVDELPELIQNLLSDRVTLSEKAVLAQNRATVLAVTNFWTEIDQVLRGRRLPPLLN